MRKAGKDGESGENGENWSRVSCRAKVTAASRPQEMSHAKGGKWRIKLK